MWGIILNDNQITAIIVAMINNRYLIPGKDNERTAKEIVRVFRILKEKTYDEDDYYDENVGYNQLGDQPSMNNGIRV
jgi:hypothetical protein